MIRSNHKGLKRATIQNTNTMLLEKDKISWNTLFVSSEQLRTISIHISHLIKRFLRAIFLSITFERFPKIEKIRIFKNKNSQIWIFWFDCWSKFCRFDLWGFESFDFLGIFWITWNCQCNVYWTLMWVLYFFLPIIFF